jgi:hypothetical protein
MIMMSVIQNGPVCRLILAALLANPHLVDLPSTTVTHLIEVIMNVSLQLPEILQFAKLVPLVPVLKVDTF